MKQPRIGAVLVCGFDSQTIVDRSMQSVVSTMTELLRTLFFSVLLILAGCATGHTAGIHDGKLQQLSVVVDGHTFALWSRAVTHSRGSILLLHGRTWSALPDFDLQIPGEQRSIMMALNEHGYTAYAVDQRGYGSTPRDASGWLTPDRAAADLTGVLKWIAEHDHRPPTLVGWSRGSLISHLAVQAHPQLVANLILVGYPRDPATTTPITDAPVAPARVATTRADATSDFISPAVTPQILIDTYVQAALTADPVRTDWRDLDQFNALDPAKITVPTLLIQGERDPLAPTAAQARFFTSLGTADKQWVVLAGGDHAALLEDTMPAFIAAIVAFVERPAPLRTAR